MNVLAVFLVVVGAAGALCIGIAVIAAAIARASGGRVTRYDPIQYSSGGQFATGADSIGYYVNSNDGEMPGQGHEPEPVASHRWWEPAMDARADEMANQWDRLQSLRAEGESVETAREIAQVSIAQSARENYGRSVGDIEIGDVYRRDAISGNWYKDTEG